MALASKCYQKKVLMLFGICFYAINIFAQEEASKYTILPFADQYWHQTGPYPTAFSNVGVFSIVETDNKSFDSNQHESMILTLPAGFEFNTAAKHSVTFTPNKDIKKIILDSITSSQIIFTISIGNNDQETDKIHFNNIEIRALAPDNSGHLLRIEKEGGKFKIDGSIENPANKDSFGYLHADAIISESVDDASENGDFVEELLMMLKDEEVWGEDPPDSKELPVIHKAIEQIEVRIENRKNEIDKLESMLETSETPDDVVRLVLEIDAKKKAAKSIEQNLISVNEQLEGQGLSQNEIKNHVEIIELERQKEKKESEIVRLEKELENSYTPDSIVNLVISIDERKKELNALEKELRRNKAREIALMKIIKETEAQEKLDTEMAKTDFDPDIKEDVEETSEPSNVGKDQNIVQDKPKTNKYLVLDNSLFDFDKSSLGIKEIPSLDQLAEFLKKNLEKRVEITGHTDNRGSKTYNLQLSKKRSQSIADYLISRGINQTRLIVTGYGETMPVKANQNPDGSDNPEGRRLNRRTEVKTIE